MINIKENTKGKCNNKDLSFLTYGKIYDLLFDNDILEDEMIYAVQDDTGRWIQWGGNDFDLALVDDKHDEKSKPLIDNVKEYQHWDIYKINKTDDGQLITAVELRDKDYNTLSLDFKWDGCINIWKRYNGYTNDSEFSKDVEENTDYIHICDLEEYINQLQEVLIIAKDILGEEKYERDFR